ncbi:3'-5' exonuclease [Dechloromonas sp. ARDL1]|uniref:3'-5' exonuclease n=1 Tax=Dechloromonas sp. ARDL1 TaxID=3322121 RepID=UPI003DA6CE5D
MTAIIFDTETTGINEPEVIEAAFLSILNPFSLGITSEYCQRFKPSKRIELGALATHHILDEDLDDCPPSSEFRLPNGIEYIIGHNVDYDWKVIGEPPVKRICTLALCRHLFPEADSHSQSAMIYLFRRATARDKLKNAHAALDDVKNCRIILDVVLDKMGATQETTWEDVWLFSEKARIPTVMTFGKHKGEAIANIPIDYKAWLLRQPDVDPYLVKALRGELS